MVSPESYLQIKTTLQNESRKKVLEFIQFLKNKGGETIEKNGTWEFDEERLLLKNLDIYLKEQPFNFFETCYHYLLFRIPIFYDIANDQFFYKEESILLSLENLNGVNLKTLVHDFIKITRLNARLGMGISRRLHYVYSKLKNKLMNSIPNLTANISHEDILFFIDNYKNLNNLNEYNESQLINQLAFLVKRPIFIVKKLITILGDFNVLVVSNFNHMLPKDGIINQIFEKYIEQKLNLNSCNVKCMSKQVFTNIILHVTMEWEILQNLTKEFTTKFDFLSLDEDKRKILRDNFIDYYYDKCITNFDVEEGVKKIQSSSSENELQLDTVVPDDVILQESSAVKTSALVTATIMTMNNLETLKNNSVASELVSVVNQENPEIETPALVTTKTDMKTPQNSVVLEIKSTAVPDKTTPPVTVKYTKVQMHYSRFLNFIYLFEILYKMYPKKEIDTYDCDFMAWPVINKILFEKDIQTKCLGLYNCRNIFKRISRKFDQAESFTRALHLVRNIYSNQFKIKRGNLKPMVVDEDVIVALKRFHIKSLQKIKAHKAQRPVNASSNKAQRPVNASSDKTQRPVNASSEIKCGKINREKKSKPVLTLPNSLYNNNCNKNNSPGSNWASSDKGLLHSLKLIRAKLVKSLQRSVRDILMWTDIKYVRLKHIDWNDISRDINENFGCQETGKSLQDMFNELKVSKFGDERMYFMDTVHLLANDSEIKHYYDESFNVLERVAKLPKTMAAAKNGKLNKRTEPRHENNNESHNKVQAKLKKNKDNNNKLLTNDSADLTRKLKFDQDSHTFHATTNEDTKDIGLNIRRNRPAKRHVSTDSKHSTASKSQCNNQNTPNVSSRSTPSASKTSNNNNRACKNNKTTIHSFTSSHNKSRLSSSKHKNFVVKASLKISATKRRPLNNSDSTKSKSLPKIVRSPNSVLERNKLPSPLSLNSVKQEDYNNTTVLLHSNNNANGVLNFQNTHHPFKHYQYNHISQPPEISALSTFTQPYSTTPLNFVPFLMHSYSPFNFPHPQNYNNNPNNCTDMLPDFNPQSYNYNYNFFKKRC